MGAPIFKISAVTFGFQGRGTLLPSRSRATWLRLGATTGAAGPLMQSLGLTSAGLHPKYRVTGTPSNTCTFEASYLFLHDIFFQPASPAPSS